MPGSSALSVILAILHVQFFYFAGMVRQEDTAALRVLILHQLSHQLCSKHAILHRHPFEHTAGRIEGRIAQLFGVHLAETFKTFELQALSIGMRAQKCFARLIIKQPLHLSLVSYRIKGRTSNIDMSSFYEI